MKIVINNKHNLLDSDINEKIYRSRAIMINKSNEILLGFCKDTYQFPGGYLEAGEIPLQGLIREVLEETGIDISYYDKDPIYVIKHYNKDWPRVGVNRYTEFNYYLVDEDRRFDLSKTNLDESEKADGYSLVYVNINNIEDLLSESLAKNDKNKKVYPEIRDILEYIKIKKA